MLFACAEALYAHGYSNEACRLAVELARDLLANPPDLKVEQPQTKVIDKLKLSNLLGFTICICPKHMNYHACQIASFKIVCLVILIMFIN